MLGTSDARWGSQERGAVHPRAVTRGCEARVPLDHPLRPIQKIVDEALGAVGRPAILAMRSVAGCVSALRRCFAGSRRPSAFARPTPRPCPRRLDVQLDSHGRQSGAADEADAGGGVAQCRNLLRDGSNRLETAQTGKIDGIKLAGEQFAKTVGRVSRHDPTNPSQD
jgi:hypothetical protein